MTRRTRLSLRVLAGLLVALGLVLYSVRALAVRRDLREGRQAYEALCERITASATVSGSPGSIAHLVAAMQVELKSLAARHPRWYDAYRKDPGAHPCGPQVPDTQVGSDR